MGLKDYEVKRDKFEPCTQQNHYDFPCNVCQHRHKDEKAEPCRTCDHNANAEKE